MSRSGSTRRRPRHHLISRGFVLGLPILLVLLISTTASAYEVAVNCGGDAYMGSEGRLFRADQPYEGNDWGYDGGVNDWQWLPIGGSTDSILYRSLRVSVWRFDYHFDVPADTYDVTLRFVEVKSHWYDQNFTQVSAEGAVLLDSLDIFTEVERAYALNARFRVAVDDGVLDLVFFSQGGNAQVAAIEVVTAESAPGGPGPPQSVQVIPGYNCMIVDWPRHLAPDLKAYQVERRDLPDGQWAVVQEPIFLLSRLIDKQVDAGGQYAYRVSAVDLEGLTSTPSSEVFGTVRLREESPLRDYEILATEENLRLLHEDPWTEEYLPAEFAWGEQHWDDAGMRYRSDRARSKKNWKIRFYGDLFEYQNRINLQGCYTDPSMVREAFGFRMAEMTGGLSCRTERANVFLNGQHRGIHAQIEQIDEHWLEYRGLPDDCPVFKCLDGLNAGGGSGWYRLFYERKVGPEDDYTPIQELCEAINYTSDEEFPEVISRTIDLYDFMNWYSFQIISGSRDFATHNFYAVQHSETGIWRLVPWDMDVTMGSSGTYLHNYDATTAIDLGTAAHPDLRGTHALVERLLQFEKFRWMFARRIQELLSEPFDVPTWTGEFNAAVAEIAPDVEADHCKWGWETSGLHHQHVSLIQNYIEQRHAFLLGEVQDYQPDIEFGIRLNEFLAQNNTTIADEFGEYEDWIEIVNTTDQPIDLGGFRLSDDLHEARQWSFPDTVIPPRGFLLIWADDEPEQGPLHATFKLSRYGEAVALWDRDIEGNVLIDYAVFGEQTADVSMGRIPDGTGDWVFLDPPTPGVPNDPASVGEEPPSGPPPRAGAHWIEIAPNPVQDLVSLTLMGASTSGKDPAVHASHGLAIFDLQGRKVAAVSLSGNPPSVSCRLRKLLGSHPQGVYWVRCAAEGSSRCRPGRIIYLGGP